jgi:ribonuclease HI
MSGESTDDNGAGELPTVHLFTDGACSGNPGPGGWAYIIRHVSSGKEKECAGGEAHTTNNRMELQAVMEGLSALKRPCNVVLYLDSEYVRQGLESWMAGWKRNGWRRREKGSWKPVKNDDLWKKLDELIFIHDMTYVHVDGHSGHRENERCDELAVEASQKFRR